MKVQLKVHKGWEPVLSLTNEIFKQSTLARYPVRRVSPRFLPDHRVVTGTSEGSVLVWNVEAGQVTGAPWSDGCADLAVSH